MKAYLPLFFIILFGLNLPAVAAPVEGDAPRPGPGSNRHQWCADNPQKCQMMKSRMQERCARDPKRCEEMKSRRAERKAWCKANPEACRKKREEMKTRRDEMRVRCQADPETCKRKRAEIRQRREQCRANPDSCQHPHRGGAPGSMPHRRI